MMLRSLTFRHQRRKDLPRCGAKTRAGGGCLVRAEPGRRRCRFHGGLSTGPKTEVGRARIAEAQRRRWQAYRANKGPNPAQFKPWWLLDDYE